MDTKRLSNLPLEDQIQLLYQHGVYLAKRRAGQHVSLLYSIGDQFAEIFFVTYRCEVERIMYSSEPELLEPYLDQIDITSAVGNA